MQCTVLTLRFQCVILLRAERGRVIKITPSGAEFTSGVQNPHKTHFLPCHRIHEFGNGELITQCDAEISSPIIHQRRKAHATLPPIRKME